jgi:hypothetical protein
MPDLEPPDSFHLSAARGWLELGNATEAGEELARVSSPHLNHPDVLEVRWEVCAAGRSWDAAADVAEQLVAVAPDRVSGWVHRAFAIRRMRQGGLPLAWAALRPAWERFPNVPVIPYNLACYAAQSGRLDEAWDWLGRAVTAAGDVQCVKAQALRDPDLEPLWERIRGMK